MYRLAELINHAFGPMIFMYVARSIVYNSGSFDYLLFAEEGNSGGHSTFGKIIWKLVQMEYIAKDVLIFLFAADVHRRVI